MAGMAGMAGIEEILAGYAGLRADQAAPGPV
jgi:hypothetical protein